MQLYTSMNLYLSNYLYIINSIYYENIIQKDIYCIYNLKDVFLIKKIV